MATSQLQSIFSFQIPGLGQFTPEQIKNLRDYLTTDTHDTLVNKYAKINRAYTDPNVFNVLTTQYVPNVSNSQYYWNNIGTFRDVVANWNNVKTLNGYWEDLVGSDGIALYWRNTNNRANLKAIVNAKDNLLGTDGIVTYWLSKKSDIKDIVNSKTDLLDTTNGILPFWVTNRTNIKSMFTDILTNISIPNESYYSRFKVLKALSSNYDMIKNTVINLNAIKGTLGTNLLTTTLRDNILTGFNLQDIYDSINGFASFPDFGASGLGLYTKEGTDGFLHMLENLGDLYGLTHPNAGSYYNGNPYWSGIQSTTIFKLSGSSNADLLGLSISFAIGGVVGAFIYSALSSQTPSTSKTAGFGIFIKNLRGAMEAYRYLAEKIITGDRNDVTTTQSNFAITSSSATGSGTPDYDGKLFPPTSVMIDPTSDMGVMRFQLCKLQMLIRLRHDLLDLAFWHIQRMWKNPDGNLAYGLFKKLRDNFFDKYCNPLQLSINLYKDKLKLLTNRITNMNNLHLSAFLNGRLNIDSALYNALKSGYWYKCDGTTLPIGSGTGGGGGGGGGQYT